MTQNSDKLAKALEWLIWLEKHHPDTWVHQHADTIREHITPKPACSCAGLDEDLPEHIIDAAIDAFEEDQARAPSQKRRAMAKAIRAAHRCTISQPGPEIVKENKQSDEEKDISILHYYLSGMTEGL